MVKFARIVNDEAVDVFDSDPAGLFTPDLVFEEVPDTVMRGGRRVLDAEGHFVWLEPPVAVEVLPVDPVPLHVSHWEAIKQERDRRTQQGGYQVAGKWFHSDTFSRTQQMGLVMMGANIPANLQWKTMDGSFVTMTQTLAGQVLAAAAASDAALFARAEQIKAAMEADPLTFNLQAKSWPVMFGD